MINSFSIIIIFFHHSLKELKRRLKRDENKFQMADENNDGFLERHEYVYFRHPEESIREGLQDIAANEVLDDIDQNGDRY